MQQVGTIVDEIKRCEERISSSSFPSDLKERLASMLERVKHVSSEPMFLVEYEHTINYIDWVLSLPWNVSTEDILDLEYAKKILDKNHYGLAEVKNKILEYLSILILKSRREGDSQMHVSAHAPVISLIGLVGTGKTTVAYSIAEALGRKIERIPCGGMGGAAMLRGQSRLYPDAEPGLITKALRRAGANNPVVLLDEIDRVSVQVRSDIMGVLVELLDPEQNKSFTDHFIDYPFNLSRVLFIVTANNTKDISTAVLDRLEIIHMPSYTDDEKMNIGKLYMFPKILTESGLTDADVLITEDVWPFIIRPLGFDPGIRSLQRTIQDMVHKVARLILEGKIEPNQKFRISGKNAKEFLPLW